MADKKNTGFNFSDKTLVVLVVLTLILGAIYWYQTSPKPYTAVVMVTGDVYFGQVSYFPKMTINNAYTIQGVENPQAPGEIAPQVVPVELLLWGPSSITVNPENVLFTSSISDESEVMAWIRGDQAVE